MQQPPAYVEKGGQPQPYAGQPQPYAGQPYAGQPQPYAGQPQPYAGQPGGTTVVVVNQQVAAPILDYSFPRGKAPGGIMIFIALVNILTYIIGGAMSPILWAFTDPIGAFIFYIIAGILGVVGARNQTNHGVAIACIVMSCFALITAFSQTIYRALWTAVFLAYGVVGVPFIVLLLLALAAFACSIALIVFASKVTCCRPADQRAAAYQTTTAYQTPPAVQYAHTQQY